MIYVPAPTPNGDSTPNGDYSERLSRVRSGCGFVALRASWSRNQRLH